MYLLQPLDRHPLRDLAIAARAEDPASQSRLVVVIDIEDLGLAFALAGLGVRLLTESARAALERENEIELIRRDVVLTAETLVSR